MRKTLCAVSACALLLYSCTGNRVPPTGDTAADSLESTDGLTVADTLEQIVDDTPMPKAADELFDDFFFNFVANKRLQLERVAFPLPVSRGNKVEQVSKKQWKMDRFFMRQGYYTLMFNSDRQMALMKDTAVSHAIVEKIMLDKGTVRDYVFNRMRGVWMLREIRETAVDTNANGSFLKFYNRFVTDSAFQVASLNQTVTFVGPDPDDDFNMMEGMITPDTWGAFAPTLPSGMIYNIVYGDPEEEGRQKIFILRGISNGLEVELRFKKVGGRWLLMKLTT